MRKAILGGTILLLAWIGEEVRIKEGGADSRCPRVVLRCFKSGDGSKRYRILHLAEIQLLTDQLGLPVPVLLESVPRKEGPLLYPLAQPITWVNSKAP